MITEYHRCVGCMKEIDTQICPYCGYDDATKVSKEFLAPRTLLQDRYLVGRVLSSNGEGVTYIAYDLAIDSIIEIREFFPDTLCKRAEDESADLLILPDKTVQYKSLLADFEELYEALMKVRTLPSVQQVYAVFHEHHTVYAVREHIVGVPLADYLINHSGKLDWNTTYDLFLPLLKTLSSIHSLQVLHRGISPSTIFVTKSGALKLTDFCISSERNIHSEITPQIYMGYAAPEQVITEEYQGTWTDVYAICCVLYRVLTGNKPPELNARNYEDSLIPPSIINRTVSSKVSDVILDGMIRNSEIRIRTLSELISAFKASAVPVEEDKKPVKEKKSLRKKNPVLFATLITAAVLVVIGAIIVITVVGEHNRKKAEDSSEDSLDSSISSELDDSESSKSESSKSEESIPDDLFSMPKLVDQIYDAVMGNEGYKELFTVEATYEYSDLFERGKIISQSVPVDQQVEPGIKVDVVVSKGSKTPVVPDFKGNSKDTYIAKLDDLGIKYSVDLVFDDSVQKGKVVDVIPGAGSMIDLESGTVVIVQVAG